MKNETKSYSKAKFEKACDYYSKSFLKAVNHPAQNQSMKKRIVQIYIDDELLKHFTSFLLGKMTELIYVDGEPDLATNKIFPK